MGWDDEKIDKAVISQEQRDMLPTKDDMTIAMFKQLDDDDKSEIRGEIKHMLKADKYSNTNTISDDIIDELKQDARKTITNTK